MKKRFKLNIELPAAAQSDLAFLLIIFFIISAIYFEHSYINFHSSTSENKKNIYAENQIIILKLFNNSITFKEKTFRYDNFSEFLKNYIQNSEKDKVLIYFSRTLKYKKFIKILEVLKRKKSIKISLKPLNNENDKK